GNGNDTIILSGNLGDYEWTGTAGDFTITDLRVDSPDGTNTVIDVEVVEFSNATFSTEALFANVKLYDEDGNL
ncbi:MAG: hypothetical protein P5681_26885, partial [Limnospira sp. PMC 894.15]|uniref:hypothetical protein n=1 Tax=Limnospira sp. PMC 894.15 TaxID=2981100 RepID=UPI0028E184AF